MICPPSTPAPPAKKRNKTMFAICNCLPLPLWAFKTQKETLNLASALCKSINKRNVDQFSGIFSGRVSRRLKGCASRSLFDMKKKNETVESPKAQLQQTLAQITSKLPFSHQATLFRGRQGGPVKNWPVSWHLIIVFRHRLWSGYIAVHWDVACGILFACFAWRLWLVINKHLLSVVER